MCGHAREVVGVATSSDGELLATACRDGSTAVWNMNSLEQTAVFHAPKKVYQVYRNIAPGCCFLIYIRHSKLKVFLSKFSWNEHHKNRYTVHLIFILFQECLCIAFAPAPLKSHVIVSRPPANEKGQPHESSLHLAVGYSDGSVRIFTRGAGTWSERKMKPHGSPVTKIAFSADGMYILHVENRSVCESVKLVYFHTCCPGCSCCALAYDVHTFFQSK